MRQPPSPRRARRLRRCLAVGALAGSAVVGALAACGPNEIPYWVCDNPATGKLDYGFGDPNHYTNGVYDPCFCFGPCGPSPECPIAVDAGPPPPGVICDAGTDGP
jgi:hypothetical protein